MTTPVDYMPSKDIVLRIAAVTQRKGVALAWLKPGRSRNERYQARCDEARSDVRLRLLGEIASLAAQAKLERTPKESVPVLYLDDQKWHFVECLQDRLLERLGVSKQPRQVGLELLDGLAEGIYQCLQEIRPADKFRQLDGLRFLVDSQKIEVETIETESL